MNIVLVYFAYKYGGDWTKIYKALEAKEKVTIQQLEEQENKLKKDNISILTILDPDYPVSLKECYKPPFVIFYKGNLDILKHKKLCWTGNDVNAITKKRINRDIKKIKQNYTLVNSLWKGFDQYLFELVVNNKKNILLVSPNGLDQPFFSKEVVAGQNILIISEYPTQTEVTKEKLSKRNRILAGLSDSLLLYNSKKYGGIESLVSAFLNLGKDIYCYPGIEDDAGNNNLIKQGAIITTNINEIL